MARIPESAALKSSASSLSPAGLGSSGPLALVTDSVHRRPESRSALPAPPPGQHSPLTQRQTLSSRVKR